MGRGNKQLTRQHQRYSTLLQLCLSSCSAMHSSCGRKICGWQWRSQGRGPGENGISLRVCFSNQLHLKADTYHLESEVQPAVPGGVAAPSSCRVLTGTIRQLLSISWSAMLLCLSQTVRYHLQKCSRSCSILLLYKTTIPQALFQMHRSTKPRWWNCNAQKKTGAQ